MTSGKRLFDLFVAGVLVVLLWPVMVLVALAILILDGRPVIYASQRMRAVSTPFTLLKFRTMRADPSDSGVTGADKADRITRSGGWLRRYRLDELPQLFNVLSGDMSLVGPRPPLKAYVDAAPALYARVLQCRPGLTGLATLAFRRHEEWLLSQCQSLDETHQVYLRRCVPAKAKLDLIYRDNRSVCYDAALLWETIRQLMLRR